MVGESQGLQINRKRFVDHDSLSSERITSRFGQASLIVKSFLMQIFMETWLAWQQETLLISCCFNTNATLFCISNLDQNFSVTLKLSLGKSAKCSLLLCFWLINFCIHVQQG